MTTRKCIQPTKSLVHCIWKPVINCTFVPVDFSPTRNSHFMLSVVFGEMERTDMCTQCPLPIIPCV